MITEIRKIELIKTKIHNDIILTNKELAIDEYLSIFINETHYSTMIATLSHVEELAVGHMFTEGIIESINDIKSINFRDKDIWIDLNHKRDIIESSANIIKSILNNLDIDLNRINLKLFKINNDKNIDVDKIIEMDAEINRRSIIHRKTRGTHAAMICDINGEFLEFDEDIGRHNAVDKVIGAMIIEKKDLENSILISTGRLSAEIIFKCVRTKIPIIITKAVPLVSGIRLAEKFGQTLISVNRGQIKVYSNAQRIKV